MFLPPPTPPLPFSSSFEVPWTWERESRGPKPESLKKSRKSLPGPGAKSPKKVSKMVRKVKKMSEDGFGRLFGPLSRPVSDFWDPVP